ncbi:MAG: winged helix-turn-helix transcriptional regulator [Solirubrobacteraceae bacterium]
MRGKSSRTYGDGCATARALDLVGERWALLVVRELLLGPKRYTDLRRGLPGASPNVLSQRLRELESGGVIRRRQLPPPAASRVYELTDWGRDLDEIVLSLGGWAARSPTPLPDGPIVSVDSVILALRGRFDPAAAKGLRTSYELRLGDDRFRIEVAEDKIGAARGNADQWDAIIDTDADTLAAVLWGGRRLADAQRAGELTIEGDRAAARRFFRLFPVPGPAAGTSPTSGAGSRQ